MLMNFPSGLVVAAPCGLAGVGERLSGEHQLHSSCLWTAGSGCVLWLMYKPHQPAPHSRKVLLGGGQCMLLLQPVPVGAAVLQPASSWGRTPEQSVFTLSSSSPAWLSNTEDLCCPPLIVLGFDGLQRSFVAYWAPLPVAEVAFGGV